MERKNFVIITAIIILWTISLLSRFHNQSRLLPTNNVAHLFLLKAYSIWQKESPLNFYFALKHTFENEGDKFNTYYARLMDKEGNNYYISFPPLTQILLWIVTGGGKLKLTHFKLQILASLLHLITTLILAFFIFIILNKKTLLPSLFASVIFLFHPVLLYSYTHHFFSETISITMTIIGLFLIWKIIKQNNHSNNIIIQLAVFCFFFLFCFTDWYGYTFTVSFALIWFFNRKLVATRIVILALTGAFLAFFLYCVQNIALSDIYSFIRAIGIRYVERSGFFGQRLTDLQYSYDNPKSYYLLGKQVLDLLKGAGFLFCFSVFCLLKTKVITRNHWLLAKMVLLASLIFSILVFSATVLHYTYIAKWTLVFLLFSTFGVATLIEHYSTKLKKWYTILGFTSTLFLLLYWSVEVYKQKSSIFRQATKLEEAIALDIKQSVAKNQAILAEIDKKYHPNLIIWLSYMSQRNIGYARDSISICHKNKHIEGYYIYKLYPNYFTKVFKLCK